MSLFERIAEAPPDPILGITEIFREDKRPGKINLTAGVYLDETGTIPALPSVREAEKLLIANGRARGYLPMSGMREFNQAVRKLAFGHERAATHAECLASLQTPGGTGALRLAGDFLHHVAGIHKIWVSEPTWANHIGIFRAAGLDVGEYRYYDPNGHRLDLEGMLNDIRQIPAGDIVLLHACCHNPSGVDPSREDWKQIATICAEKHLLPLLDFAYQGFDQGIEEDAAAVGAFADAGLTFFVASSFSKNFGLYQDRCGVLHVKTADADETRRVFSQLQICVRTNYSNPPAFGAHVVDRILSDSTLRAQWVKDVAAMRERIRRMREQFVETLKAAGVEQDFSFLIRQKGMFSFSGLTAQQVRRLRDEHAVYMVANGRISVAGMTSTNIPPLCEAIRAVIQS